MLSQIIHRSSVSSLAVSAPTLTSSDFLHTKEFWTDWECTTTEKHFCHPQSAHNTFSIYFCNHNYHPLAFQYHHLVAQLRICKHCFQFFHLILLQSIDFCLFFRFNLALFLQIYCCTRSSLSLSTTIFQPPLLVIFFTWWAKINSSTVVQRLQVKNLSSVETIFLPLTDLPFDRSRSLLALM